jgi:type I restriction enzyme S subunit
MLPKGWKRNHLHRLISSLEAGVSVNGEDRRAMPGEMGVLRVSAVSNGTFLPHEHKAIVKDEIALAKTSPKTGRVIFSRSNTEALVGASAYVAEDYPDLYLSDKLWQLEPNSDVPTSMRWLAYWLASDHTRKQLSKLGTGTSGSMKNISKEELLALRIAIPPYKEQCVIAGILLTWDDAIAATEKLLANSRKQKLALMSKVLRFPVPAAENIGKTDNGGYPVSVQPGIPNLPDMPNGWKRIHLGGHLREVVRPVRLEPEQQYTLVTVKRSRGGVQLREVLRGAEIKTPSQFQVRAGDFLISKRQIVHGACGIVPAELDGAIVSNEYAVLASDGEIDLKFLRYLSETRYFQQTCFHSSIGVHVEKMIFKTERWLAWPFNIPPLCEQLRIVEVLDTAVAETELLASQSESLRSEKRALMQQLLTGKRRVRVSAAETTP